jgi:signal transduction histidine kinase/DNA-binding response OmpR family regulator/HAMP domain-containing protein
MRWQFFPSFAKTLRVQLLLMMGLAVGTLLVVVLYFFSAATETNNLRVRRQVVSELVVGAFQLNSLLAEYLQFPSSRVQTQWQSRHASLEQALAQVGSLVKPENRALYDNVRTSLAEMPEHFGQMVENTKRTDVESGLLAAQTMQKVTRLRLKSDALVADALQWSKALEAQEAQLQIRQRWTLAGTGLLLFAIIGLMLERTLRGLLRPMRRLQSGIDTVSAGDLTHRIDLPLANEIGEIASAFNRMTSSLLAGEASIREKTVQLERENWLRAAQIALHARMQGDLSQNALADAVLAGLAEYTGAQVGVFFVAEKRKLRLAGRYAYRRHAEVPETFVFGEGLVGQAAASGQIILLNEVPENYVMVGSALGQMPPRHILVLPILYGTTVNAVIELASMQPFDSHVRQFLELAAVPISIAVQMAQSRERVQTLLAKSQDQAEELQAQQEELRVSNEELADQAERLKMSEERLRNQQEELQVSNEELEEKNNLLKKQKHDADLARKELLIKAEELALASKYKSEFLANMSHELRTPLNSLLLLAYTLAQNEEGNLTAEQIEYARIIHASGSDLLSLINDILDLSRIEAGRINLDIGIVHIEELIDGLHASFDHMAHGKELDFDVVVDSDVPTEMTTDRKRLNQILRNLVSNAIKFTEAGSVKVSFACTPAGTDPGRSGSQPDKTLVIAVKDTGIGIHPDKQKLIFDAFQQADGSTTRKYGGTGLGLTISRELAALLGGGIQVESAPGEGSTFTLSIPLHIALKEQPRTQSPGGRARVQPAVDQAGSEKKRAVLEDDRTSIEPGDKSILIIEDDLNFAAILRNQCRAMGFKCLVASVGEDGVALAGEYLPAAIILDLRLPHMDGLAVLSALKANTRTRHIPVHVVSGADEIGDTLRRGAVGYAVKPLKTEDLDAMFHKLAEVSSDKPKRVLVVEDDPVIRSNTVDVIGSGNTMIDEAGTGAQALQLLREKRYDCVVLDLRLPDMDGRELLHRLAAENVELPPVVVHTSAELSEEEVAALRERADAIVVKDTRSPERLLDEVSLFLHRVVSQMPERQRQIIHDLYDTDAQLRGKKILVVDDDMRTTFAIAKLLSDRGMEPIKAADGVRALKLLDEHPDTAIVLMDIMMPTMDGYETIRRIRGQMRLKKLPIIALTAKAMPEDREKCLAAGANDYLPKPVDPVRLFSMMRVWLYG